jgi:hypothetical protein
MTDIVKGMARAYFEAHFADGWSYAEMEEKVPGHNADMEHSMRAALMWLADNVSKEMGVAYLNESNRTGLIRSGIAAAIRAAAGGE